MWFPVGGQQEKYRINEGLVLLKNKFLGYKNIVWNTMMFVIELNKTHRWYYCQKIGKLRKKNSY